MISPGKGICEICQGINFHYPDCSMPYFALGAISSGDHCSDHPDAPHGFDRNASHSESRYVCDCESWRKDE